MPFDKTRKKRVIEPGPKVCHPRLQGKYDECLSDERLNELSRAYAAPSELTGTLLRKWLTRKAHCKTERCLIEKAPMDEGKRKYLLRRYYRPKRPKEWKTDPDLWLDSNNITDVMKQYEETYPHFKYYGANPIDFAAPDPYDKQAAAENKCLNEDICKLNLKDLLKRGKTRLGFIYNLDPSDKEGSHWIASFTDIPAHKSYYFDSYGMRPPKQVARFMRSLTLQDPSMKLEYNARRFQFKESECGMYCLYFLIRMLEGDDFKAFCRRAPKDKEMLELRKWLFS
jgi:hypothetical protein